MQVKKRKTKNTPYMCPVCLKVFYIENKSEYPFIHCNTAYCKEGCMIKAKERKRAMKILGLKGDFNK